MLAKDAAVKKENQENFTGQTYPQLLGVLKKRLLNQSKPAMPSRSLADFKLAGFVFANILNLIGSTTESSKPLDRSHF